MIYEGFLSLEWHIETYLPDSKRQRVFFLTIHSTIFVTTCLLTNHRWTLNHCNHNKSCKTEHPMLHQWQSDSECNSTYCFNRTVDKFGISRPGSGRFFWFSNTSPINRVHLLLLWFVLDAWRSTVCITRFIIIKMLLNPMAESELITLGQQLKCWELSSNLN